MARIQEEILDAFYAKLYQRHSQLYDIFRLRTQIVLGQYGAEENAEQRTSKNKRKNNRTD